MNFYGKGKDYLLLHMVVIIWGFAGIFGRMITIPAINLVWYRLAIAPLGIFAYLKLKHIPLKISTTEMLKFLGVGAIITIHWIAFYTAIKLATVSVTLVCFSTVGLFTALLEPLFFNRRLNWVEIVCGCLVIFALSLIFSIEPKYKIGMLLSLVSSLLAAFFTIFNAQMVRTSDSRLMSFYELVFGLLLLSGYFIITKQFDAGFFTISNSNWGYILLFSLVGTAFSFTVSSEILKSISPYTVNITVNLEVVYGIVLAYFIFGEDERMTWGFYTATLIILFALFANAWLKKKTA